MKTETRSVFVSALICAALCAADPGLEAATITVTTPNDSGAGSLREAMATAGGGDTIGFAPTLNGQTILLTSGELDINTNLTILGPGATQLTVSGNHSFGVFYVAPGVTSTISGLTITGGRTALGGGVQSVAALLTLDDCRVTDNAAVNGGGGEGGGIAAIFGTLMMNRTTVSGNVADEAGGVFLGNEIAIIRDCTISGNRGVKTGGLLTEKLLVISGTTPMLTLINTTLSGNIASQGGSAIAVSSFPEIHFPQVLQSTLLNCTVTSNTVSQAGVTGGAALWLNGGPLNLTLTNTIVSGNTAAGMPADISGTVDPASSYNLIGAGSGLNNGVNGNIVGMNDPLVGPLTDNGGPTLTHALLCGSRAIDAGYNPGAPATDQRGLPRIVDTIDIGALEVQSQAPGVTCPSNMVVTNASGLCSAQVDFAVTTCGVPPPLVVCTLNGRPITSPYPFPVGINVVTCTASNATSSTKCSFTVSVQSPGPVVICPADLIVASEPGLCSQEVALAVTTCGVPAPLLTCVLGSEPITSPHRFRVGANLVTCTASNVAGSMNCSFTVSVLDKEPPAITCPASVTVNTSAGNCASNVTFTVTASDQCGTANVVCTPASGTPFSKGVTTVDCTADDGNGNTTSCSFTVTVLDLEPPIILCPANLTVATAPGTCASNLTYSVSASDNCAGANLVCNPASGRPFNKGVTTVRCGMFDTSGSISRCTFTVTVQDQEPPTISCRADLTVNAEAGKCGAVVTYATPLTSDNCPAWSIFRIAGLASGSLFPVGQTKNVFGVRDLAGNSNTCSFVVTVVDTQPPAITCPANLTVGAAAGTCASNVTFAATATDNCNAKVNCTPASGTSFGKGETTVNCQADDGHGNTSSCSFTVTVRDQEPPIIACPANITVNTSAGSCASNVTFTVAATDLCGPASVTCIPASGTPFSKGVTTVNCTAEDGSGNMSSCSFLVTVLDQEPPVITCPANLTVTTAPGTCASNVIYSVGVSDNCPGANLVCNPGSGKPFSKGVTAVGCSLLDASGGISRCNFTVTVLDQEAPVITCPADVTVIAEAGKCAATVTYATPATSDNCPAWGIFRMAGLRSGSLFPAGRTTNVFGVRDMVGNSNACSFVVTVADPQPPVITCPANMTVTTAPGGCVSNVTFTATATDPCGTAKVVCSPASGTPFPKGVTTVNCTANNGNGNTASCNFIVTVLDQELPVLVCPNMTVATAPGSCASNVTFAVRATDNCGTANLECNPKSGTPFNQGVTTVNCTTDDSNGNTASCTFTVTVLDQEPPAIVCPGDLTVNTAPGTCASNATFTVTATDNCGTANLECNPRSGSPFNKGVTTVSCTADDGRGNTNNCSFTVTVQDLELPVIVCPANLTVTAAPTSCSSNVTFSVTATDNCGTAKVVCNPASGTSFSKGMTMVDCTADDSSGTTRCSFTVTVLDQERPEITCPADMTVNTAPGSCASNVTYNVSVIDNCPPANPVCNPASGKPFGKGVTTVRCSALDASGNISSCSFKVTVLDQELPVITCPADLTVSAATGQCGAVVTYPTPATSDNCPAWGISRIAGLRSGSSFPAGRTTNIFAVRDLAGNSNTCSFTITVLEDIPPVVIVLGQNPLTNECHVAFVDPGATAKDNCPGSLGMTTNIIGNPIVPGTYAIAYVATDASGNSATNFRTVVVADTTSPSIRCPSDLVVEATNTAGAVVSFAPVASDLCGGTNVAVICTPPAGIVFAMGTNTVHCVATDQAGNSAGCSFRVAVVGPRGTYTDVLAELTALRAGVTNANDLTRLTDAIQHLTNVFSVATWADETHVDRAHGNKVFTEVKTAIARLCDLLNDNQSSLSKPLLQEFLVRLRRATRLLAAAAIQDAANSGATPQKINGAMSELVKGDNEIALGTCTGGIGHYGNAWHLAIQATVSQLLITANGPTQLVIFGNPGVTYQVQATSNLVDWTTIATVTADASGVIGFDDPEASKFPARYYRAVSP